LHRARTTAAPRAIAVAIDAAAIVPVASRGGSGRIGVAHLSGARILSPRIGGSEESRSYCGALNGTIPLTRFWCPVSCGIRVAT
jgi:hypothetical protein